MPIEFSRNGEPLGSFAEEAIPSFVQAGAIQQTDYFWQEGMAEWQLVGTRWPNAEPAPPEIPESLLKPATATAASRSNEPLSCSQCGSKMDKTTQAQKDMALQIVGLFIGLIGIGLMFVFPLGTLLGILLLLAAARLGYKKLKVWKCSSCGYFFERAA